MPFRSPGPGTVLCPGGAGRVAGDALFEPSGEPGGALPYGRALSSLLCVVMSPWLPAGSWRRFAAEWAAR
jgi:hypothetical protein